MKERIISGIDFGTSTIKIVVGELVPASDAQSKEQVHFLGAVEHISEGLSKGSVRSIDDAVASLTQALEKAERMIGVPLSHGYISINSPQLFLQNSKGVVAVSKVDGEVKEEDVNRVVDAAQTIASPANYEILHVLPRSFTVDSERGVKDPVGMTGTRLEVDAEIVYAPTSVVRTLTKAIFRTGCEIDDIVFGVLASSESALNRRQRELGSVLLNIGAATTSFIVFEDGNVIHAGVVPLGSAYITGDIAIGLRTSLDVAEQIKRSYASALPEQWSKNDEIPLVEVGEESSESFSRKYVAEIVEARLEEIFEFVDKELKSVERSGQLPAGVVLCGGGAMIPGVLELAKRVFRLPASAAAVPVGSEGIDLFDDPRFSQSMGLVLWAATMNRQEPASSGLFRPLEGMSRFASKGTSWVRSLFH